MDIWVIVALVFAFLTCVSLIVTTIFLRETLNQERNLRTLDYVTRQFDLLEKIGARAELRKATGLTILEYIKNIPEKERDSVRDKFLQWVYAFNRIGAGIYKKSLDEEIVFQIWTPKWFEVHWDRFKSFVLQEKEKRGEEASKAYIYFHWLAKVRCPEVTEKYPEYKPKSDGED